MIRSLMIPIFNLYAKGDYTARAYVGESKKSLNLILDTGSSTLAINATLFKSDSNIVSTPLAQHVIYGKGQWLGPVVKDSITMGHDDDLLTLEQVYIALAQDKQLDVFGHADGILGLAYSSLNKAYNLSSLLVENGIIPATTFPWMKVEKIPDINILSKVKDSPVSQITPYFTQLEEHNLTANKFAFVVHRSSTFQVDPIKSNQVAADHPLNQGIFVLGNPESQTRLHNGDFIDVKVVHDKYFNVTIESIFVEGADKIEFPPLQEIHRTAFISNGIVDTGASALVFPQVVFNAILVQLKAFNPDFENPLAAFLNFTGKEIGIDMELVDLTEWPNLVIEIQGLEGKVETLKLAPESYWQTHAPEPNKISFKITSLPSWPNQGILGLPLLNNYFTIFDRSFNHGQDQQGLIRFANKTFAPHTFNDSIHQDIELMNSQFAQNGHPLHAY